MQEFQEKPVVSIDSRVFSNGYFGTVRYYGEVKGKAGLWYGVDWDNKERGKHDGTFEGVKYFSANYPTSGSFVDPLKVETGISLAFAIEERYIRCYETLTAEDSLLPQKSGDRFVEFVGAKKVANKISQIEKLRVADVRNSMVSHAGDVSTLVPNLTHLNLSTNLISDWSSVADILNQLTSLTTLDISGNRLRPLKTELPSYSPLATLVMNGMGFVWKDVTALATFLSDVKSLTLLSNCINTLDVPAGHLQNLTDLDLSHNRIASWDEVLKLRHLPRLTNLNLTKNSLNSVSISEARFFPSLHSLNLSDNQLGSWKDVAELSKLQKLERLLLARNPILKLEDPRDARQLVIAKIRTLSYFEGIEITKSERKGAEWDYIKKYWTDWQQRKDDPKFNIEHPSYARLIGVYGAPEPSSNPNFSVEKIPILSVSICCPLMPDKAPITRKLPAKIVVGKLKQMIKKWLHISQNNLILSYKTVQNGDGVERSIDDDTQFLSFYAISNGDLLCVRWQPSYL